MRGVIERFIIVVRCESAFLKSQWLKSGVRRKVDWYVCRVCRQTAGEKPGRGVLESLE